MHKVVSDDLISLKPGAVICRMPWPPPLALSAYWFIGLKIFLSLRNMFPGCCFFTTRSVRALTGEKWVFLRAVHACKRKPCQSWWETRQCLPHSLWMNCWLKCKGEAAEMDTLKIKQNHNISGCEDVIKCWKLFTYKTPQIIDSLIFLLN